jgi:surface antigen
LDQLASASIAEAAAQMTGVGEVTPITNQADSEQVLLTQASTTDDSLASKPQVVASAFKSNKDIKTYVVQSGDTVSSIAAKFGVTSDSVRWSNGLTGDAVTVGAKLLIPPVNGLVYIVKSGDTPQSLATRYNTTADKIIQYNDAEISGIQVGEVILIPDGSIVVKLASSGSRYFGNAQYSSNGYDRGYCTWWVAYMRQKAGDPLPSNLGNASTWGIRAAAFGLPTGHSPRVGAAVVTSTRGEGHVAYVVAVNDDGSIWVSEMNSHGQVSMTDPTSTGGWNRVDYKMWPASEALSFTYIY